MDKDNLIAQDVVLFGIPELYGENAPYRQEQIVQEWIRKQAEFYNVQGKTS